MREPMRFRVGVGFLSDITVEREPPYLEDSDTTEAPPEIEDEIVAEEVAVKCVLGTVDGCKTILRSSVPSSE
jgi:hypothetical protein